MAAPGPQTTATAAAKRAALIVVNPSGTRLRVPLEPLPFSIGRQADNSLVLRDSRASRNHARIVEEDGHFVLEDLNSRHGVFVNGARVQRHVLRNSDAIEFGVPDSYRLVFLIEEAEMQRFFEQFAQARGIPGSGSNSFTKLRAMVEVARAVQSSLSTEDILTSVVDAALTMTGAERGFLLLKKGDDLQVAVARSSNGTSLSQDDLQVPTRLIHRALQQRRDLLTMDFDPFADGVTAKDVSVAYLALRSVVCVPLVRVKQADANATSVLSSLSETIGLLYLDSRAGSADLSSGTRELLQTLAMEASTVLENARLLEEERKKLRIEEELGIARDIQQGLMPRSLPAQGWFRASGSSMPTHQVGGDYFDVHRVNESCWTAVVADVSGKGVSSALLAALLQGAFLVSTEGPGEMETLMRRVNRFLNDRTQGEKYATLFYCTVTEDGILRWTNAGHCSPILVHPDGSTALLRASGMPVGLLEDATFGVQETRLVPGDKIVIYSDGLSEAHDLDGNFFEVRRIRDICKAGASATCEQLHHGLMRAVQEFTSGTAQNDDITLLVLEYCPS